jgi:hypothetical protein
MNAYGSGSASRLSEAQQFDQLSRQIENVPGQPHNHRHGRASRPPAGGSSSPVHGRRSRIATATTGRRKRQTTVLRVWGRTETYEVHVAPEDID